MTASRATAKVTGATLRSRGGLRSTWVTAWRSLSLTRPGGPAVYGKAVTLTGKAQGVKGAVLQQRVDGVWKKVARPAAEREGEARSRPASFRIAAGKLAGPVLKVPVAPLVTRARTGRWPSPGRCEPLAARRDGRGAASRTDGHAGRRSRRRRPAPSGAFTLAVVQPGVYRAAHRAGARASPRACPGRSSSDDRGSRSLLVAAARARAARPRRRATRSALRRSPTCRGCARARPGCGEPGAAAGGRRRARAARRACATCPARRYVERLGTRRRPPTSRTTRSRRSSGTSTVNRAFDFWDDAAAAAARSASR